MSIKIGAQLYTLRDYCQTTDGFADTLARVADMGYTTVQMSGCCAYEPEWFREQLEKNGLTCELTHFELEDIVGDTDKLVADHNVYGCKYIGIGYMPAQYRGNTAKVAEFCDVFDAAATRIHELGSQLMYHNHWFEYDDRGDGKNYMEMIAERFTPEQLGFTLDTYWVAFAGYDVVSEIERLSGYISRTWKFFLTEQGDMPRSGQASLTSRRSWRLLKRRGPELPLSNRTSALSATRLTV